MSSAGRPPVPGDLVVAIVGATATGKTEVGERLAARLAAEIVCADSRQVYRELEVGTGKPTPAERRALPHHLFDLLALDQQATAGGYARAAAAVVREIRSRDRLPVFVGGSGLYIAAVRRGLVAIPEPDPAIRERLDAEIAAFGAESLHRRLMKVDPATARRLAPRDAQRVGRALEVFESTGRRFSWWLSLTAEPPVPGSWRIFELRLETRHLSSRIARRTAAMFAGGLIAEVEALAAAGRADSLRRLRAIGYEEALDLAEGTIGRDQAEARTTQRTLQLAKRQRTWFRHQVEALRLEADSSPEAIVDRILASLGGNGEAGGARV